MNKILFKLIEGKGKFFLMRDVPNEPRPCMLMNKIYGPTVPEKRHYQEDLNACISEALKNGEIVNPEVLPIEWVTTDTTSYFHKFKELKDGDTFDLPEGMGFETFFPNGLMEGKSAIRLLPEKPEQKEESQSDIMFDLYQKMQYMSVDKLISIFTIKRKD